MADIEKLLLEGQTVEFTPLGNSMHPLFESGRDKVVVTPIQTLGRRMRAGDVVLYRRPDENILVLHRVYKKRPEGYYMIGDNQTVVEGPLDESLIRGVMTSFERMGKRHTINHPWYRIFFGLWRLMTPIRAKVIKLSRPFRR